MVAGGPSPFDTGTPGDTSGTRDYTGSSPWRQGSGWLDLFLQPADSGGDHAPWIQGPRIRRAEDAGGAV